MDVKIELLNCVRAIINKNTASINAALDTARESANSEGKSSAGDKYETGRAMAQLEQEKLVKQLAEAQAQLTQIERIKPNEVSKHIGLGSLVITSNGRFFISASAGKLDIAGTGYYAVSNESPIAVKLIGRQVGDNIILNNVVYTIEKIC